MHETENVLTHKKRKFSDNQNGKIMQHITNIYIYKTEKQTMVGFEPTSAGNGALPN